MRSRVWRSGDLGGNGFLYMGEKSWLAFLIVSRRGQDRIDEMKTGFSNPSSWGTEYLGWVCMNPTPFFLVSLFLGFT